MMTYLREREMGSRAVLTPVIQERTLSKNPAERIAH